MNARWVQRPPQHKEKMVLVWGLTRNSGSQNWAAHYKFTVPEDTVALYEHPVQQVFPPRQQRPNPLRNRDRQQSRGESYEPVVSGSVQPVLCKTFAQGEAEEAQSSGKKPRKTGLALGCVHSCSLPGISVPCSPPPHPPWNPALKRGSFSTEGLNPHFLVFWVKSWPRAPSGTMGGHVAPPCPRIKHCHSDSATLQRCSSTLAMQQYSMPSPPHWFSAHGVKTETLTDQQNTADQKPTLTAGCMCFSN